MTWYRLWARAGIVLLTVAALFGLGVALHRTRSPERVIWTAPKDESIACLRTSRQSGHVWVLSARGDSWRLRDVSSAGSVTLVAEGAGPLQHPVPLSQPDWENSRIIVGQRWYGSAARTSAVECRLAKHKTVPMPWSVIIPTLALCQPYSPGSHRVAVKAEVRRTEKSIRENAGIWLLSDSPKWNRKPLLLSTDAYAVGWVRDGSLYAFRLRDGTLLRWRHGSSASEVRARLTPGVLASFAPNGRWMVIVSVDGALTVSVADIEKSSVKAVYHGRRSLDPIAVDWSSDGKRAIITAMSGLLVKPIIVDATGHARAVGVHSRGSTMYVPTAFLDDDHAAVVLRSHDDGPDSVLSVRTKGS